MRHHDRGLRRRWGLAGRLPSVLLRQLLARDHLHYRNITVAITHCAVPNHRTEPEPGSDYSVLRRTCHIFLPRCSRTLGHRDAAADTVAADPFTDPFADPVPLRGTDSIADPSADPFADPVPLRGTDSIADPSADPFSNSVPLRGTDSIADPSTDPFSDLVNTLADAATDGFMPNPRTEHMPKSLGAELPIVRWK